MEKPFSSYRFWHRLVIVGLFVQDGLFWEHPPTSEGH